MIIYDGEEEAREGGDRQERGRVRLTDSNSISTEESEVLIFPFGRLPVHQLVCCPWVSLWGEENPGLAEFTENRRDSPCCFLGSFQFSCCPEQVSFLHAAGCQGEAICTTMPTAKGRCDRLATHLREQRPSNTLLVRAHGLWQLLDLNCLYPCRLDKSIGHFLSPAIVVLSQMCFFLFFSQYNIPKSVADIFLNYSFIEL